MLVTSRSALFALAVALLAPAAFAASPDHGVLVRENTIYLSPDQNSSRLANVERGREVAILEGSGGWVRVLASITNERDVAGWMRDRGVVRASTPNGDQILYGEAVDSESEASRRRGRKGADKDAYRLYRMVAEYFPNSPLAGEALYRAADVRWQVEREEAFSRPSARERDPSMRHQIDEDLMHQVMKKYPHTKWADLAAYHLLDNKICGDWQAQAHCPEKEADLYEKYAAEHPQSPVAAEALYNAAKRRAALVDIYRTDNQPGKSAEAKNRALALTQRIESQYAQSDWAPRSRTLEYLVQQGIPTYGSNTGTPDLGISEVKP